MSQGFDRYIAWLDFTGHDQPPGYYGLLKLATFEANVDRIQDAILHESLDVSNYLHGSKRQLAEAVLEEISRAESCLTSLDSKALYDAQLRATGSVLAGESATCTLHEVPELEDEPVRLVEVSDVSIPDIFHTHSATAAPRSHDAEPSTAAKQSEAVSRSASRPRAVTADSRQANSAADVADRSVLDAVERVRRRTQDQSRKKSLPAVENGLPAVATGPSEFKDAYELPAAQVTPLPPTSTISLPSALALSLIAAIPAPLVKHRRRIGVALVCLVGLGFVVQGTMIALDKPPPPRVRVRLDPQEEALLCEQITILYDLGRETAERTAAIEKLGEASPEGIKKSAYRIKDLASRQPEPELQEALQKLLESISVDP